MAFADAGNFELQALATEPQVVAVLQALATEPQVVAVLHHYSAQAEDLYWACNYWKEPYFRADYDYEDYAPAYCVGYSGYDQYGGCWENAEKSLVANFIRIKGDSRLTLEEALEPIRSAWSRVQAASPQQIEAELGRLLSAISSPASCNVSTQ